MLKIGNVIHKIASVVSIISFVGFFGIMFLTVCDVIIRYVSGVSILGVYEIVERVMVCAVFASFAYTQTEHGHVSITMLVMKFPPKVTSIIYCIHSLLSTAISVLVIYAAYRQGNVAMSSNYTTGVLYIPLWPFYWVEIVSMAILAITLFYEAIEHFVALFSPTIAEATRKSIGGETGL